MRKILFAFIFLYVSYTISLKAQDTVRVEVSGKNVVTVVNGGGHHADVKIGKNSINIKEGRDDTVKIRVGRSETVRRSLNFYNLYSFYIPSIHS